MLVALAIILALGWIFGFTVMHVSSFAIHLLILAAVVSVVAHLLRGRRVT